VKKLDAFLQFNRYEVLKDAGKISSEIAKELAHSEKKNIELPGSTMK
jgi:hypothetical protein